VVKAGAGVYTQAMMNPDAAPAAEADTGAEEAPPELSSRVYRQLRALARSRLRQGGRETLLDTTALVHEAYLRLAGAQMGSAEQRSFLAYASRTMRSVIVDFARRRQTERRGGDACFVTLTGNVAEPQAAAADDIVRVHEALDELAQVDLRLAQVVEMRYFAGLTEAEIALALAVSERTVRRDWEKARLLLAGALGA
jgi:RNA polymerase sigma factor (TIGR02999 family)